VGLLSDFFAATPDELQALSLDWGPQPPPPQPPKSKGSRLFGFGRKREPDPPAPMEPVGPTLPTVSSKGFTGIELGTLEQILTGTSYEQIADQGLLDTPRFKGKDGPWVMRVRPELARAIVALPPSGRAAVARQWAETDELKRGGSEIEPYLVDLLGELHSLATTATSTGRDLYLWMSL
jgi:hypothetical protein